MSCAARKSDVNEAISSCTWSCRKNEIASFAFVMCHKKSELRHFCVGFIRRIVLLIRFTYRMSMYVRRIQYPNRINSDLSCLCDL
jgi:hypothetical protein